MDYVNPIKKVQSRLYTTPNENIHSRLRRKGGQQ